MKRIISMILAVMLVLSVAVAAVSAESFHGFDERAVSMKDALAAYTAETGIEVPTYRYYFQVPDGENGPATAEGTKAGSWWNDYNKDLCSVYYWATGDFPTEEWTGYLCEKTDVDNIFYVDVPQAVKTIIFNNSINGGAKPKTPEEEAENPYYFCCAQTENIKLDTELTAKTKSNKKLVYENYPEEFFTDFRMVGEGDDAEPLFDGMIYVPTPDAMNVNSFSGAQTIGGNWYYYYGNGCYGYTIDATDMKTSCLNPDHDHSNDEPATPDQPTVAPETTEPETTEPETTEPETTEPIEEGAYYIIGNMTDWTTSADYKLTKNEAAEGEEYVFEGLSLASDAQFKVVYEEDGERTWYPDGMGNNYGEHGEITTAGTYTVYFRPDADGGDDWFNGVIYAVCTEAETTEPYTESTIYPGTEPTVLPTEPETTEPATPDQPTVAPETTEPETTVPEPAKNEIYFDYESTGWEETAQVYCHIFEYNGPAFYEWQLKGEKCVDNEDGTWTYDLEKKKVNLDPEKMYCVIFSNDEGNETYQLFMDSTCLGDTVYCDGTKTENPVDSSKLSDTAYWRNKDKTEFGPVLAISSLGNVIGTACAPDTTPEKMFEDFLTNPLGFENARTYSGKDDQKLIDDIKDGLGLADAQVAEAIEKTGAEVEWKPAEIPEEGTGILGDADGDGKVTILDATYIQKTLASIPTQTKFFAKEADVNGSGKPDILDATFIQKKLASIATPYKIGEKME